MSKKKTILRYYHTLKHLKAKQVYYQLYYRIRAKLQKPPKYTSLPKPVAGLSWQGGLPSSKSYCGKRTFDFLNIKHDFGKQIDWNYSKYGKLWTYNLNYFDFLLQEDISKDTGISLINDYLKNDSNLIDGKEPYPISLRGINWIKFLSMHSVRDEQTNYVLYNHYRILDHNIEYHLLGNHLLENGFSLIFGGHYFQEEQFYKKGYHILKEELKEQILKDGGHFELSPMYHQILLGRLLEVITLLKHNDWKQDDLLSYCITIAQRMLSWMSQMTFRNGQIPLFNDATYGIAPSTEQLIFFASQLDIEASNIALQDSGYRKYKNKDYECVIDVGHIGPDYIPGHAHADTFNFEIHVGDHPYIVDTGISTYEKNQQRQTERSTVSHNTVLINGMNQSDVWGGFRVGKRARVNITNSSDNMIRATHDGYKSFGIYHERAWQFDENEILITDNILGNKANYTQEAFLHFHPDDELIRAGDFSIRTSKGLVDFLGEIEKVVLEDYGYCIGYNKQSKAQKVRILFRGNTLITKISLFIPNYSD